MKFEAELYVWIQVLYSHSFLNCLLCWIKYWLLLMRLRWIRWWTEPDFYMSAYESSTGAWYIVFSRKKHY